MEVQNTTSLIAFSGKQDDWKLWSIKFVARASLCGYKTIFLGIETAPKDSDALDPTKSRI